MHDETGAAGVEYSIVLFAVAAAIVLIALAVGDDTVALFSAFHLP